ncbi:3 beta-hydroxysteroid dehydrogenase/Delta 5--_4-isomerase-like isoform X3 [Dermacentor albipictus]|uniref:3 beta-hydroxysteroid dehydrogenase/Delta 5-->4-isomerase-like isoform X3 n=1 Tax=Dermacentor albipictus TaxID=60249 RepID=UPI0038FC33CC
MEFKTHHFPRTNVAVAPAICNQRTQALNSYRWWLAGVELFTLAAAAASHGRGLTPSVCFSGRQVSQPIAMKEHVGDICDATALGAALSGVDAVIHCASIVDSRFFADSEAMERVNVRGKGRLRTLAIRLPPLYGELDQIFITKCLQISKLTFNFVFSLDYGVQGMYAGNAASLTVQGIKILAAPAPDDVSGKFLYAADETTHDISLVLGPIAEARGAHMFPFSVPSWLVLIISCLFWSFALLLSPLSQINYDSVPSPMEIVFVRRCPRYDGKEAARKLGWKPKYSVQQAITASLDYYRNVKL